MITISEVEKAAIDAAAKANRNKRVAKRLEVLELRYAGKSNSEISIRTEYNERYVTTLMDCTKKQGLEEYIRIKQTSHRRNLTEAGEAKVLAESTKETEAGKVLTVKTIRERFEKRLGRKRATIMCIVY